MSILLLNDIAISRASKILVMAPHPDDFDVIAATLRLFYVSGCSLHLMVLTSGASGVLDSFCGTSSREIKGKIREEEQKKSLKVFGLPLKNLSFLRIQEDKDGHPIYDENNKETIKKEVIAIEPTFVFMPHGNDTNVGHQSTHALLQQIAKETRYTLIALLHRDPKTIMMQHDVYTLFYEETAEWKRQLLLCHESQHHRNLTTRNHGLDDYILRVNRSVAKEYLALNEYAEVFEIESWQTGIRLSRALSKSKFLEQIKGEVKGNK